MDQNADVLQHRIEIMDGKNEAILVCCGVQVHIDPDEPNELRISRGHLVEGLQKYPMPGLREGGVA